MAVTEVSNGKIRGTSVNGVEKYLGIPYGRAVGDLGPFSPVVPVAPWGKTLECTGIPPIFHQPKSRLEAIMGSASEMHPRSDQAFTVNVYAPNGATNLPVLVFLHGGAFSSGGGVRWYDGSRLADHAQVVVVTINYRLGIWGNFAAEGAPTNNTVNDVIAGLRWVADNISAFGGDARNVTLSGQSAGAYLSLLLTRCSQAEGLFKRAILLSCPGNINATLDDAREATDQVMGLLGAKDIYALARETPDRLLQATAALVQARYVPGNLTPLFRPYVDGNVQIESMDEPAHWNQKAHCREVLLGFTREETAAFHWDRAEHINSDPECVLEWYRQTHGAAACEAYRQVACRRPQASAYTQWIDGGSDCTFARPAMALAESFADDGSAFVYRFDLQTRQPHLYAPHCLELPFFFDNLTDWFDAPMLAGFSTEELRPLATSFSSCMTSFVKTGRPDSGGWKAYSKANPFFVPFDIRSRSVA